MKKLIILLFAVLIVLCASARQITPDEAAEIATQLLCHSQAKTYPDNCDNVADTIPMATIEWEVDEDIEIIQVVDYGDAPILDLDKGLPNQLPIGTCFYFRALLPENRQGKVNISGREGMPCYFLDGVPNEIHFWIEPIKDHTIKVQCLPDEYVEYTAIIDNADDDYFDEWLISDMEKIKSLKVEGYCGCWEWLYITNWMPGLEKLDLSKAEYYINYIGDANLLFLQYLKEFHHPKNIEDVNGSGFSFLSLIEIIGLSPQTKMVRADALPIARRKKRVFICPCEIPPVIYYLDTLGDSVADLFKDAYNSTLLVPKDTRAQYVVADGWKEFGTIREYTGDWHDYVYESDLNSVERINNQEEESFNIYNIQGICIKTAATKDDMDGLSPGLYIINNKKIYVR